MLLHFTMIPQINQPLHREETVPTKWGQGGQPIRGLSAVYTLCRYPTETPFG